MKNIALLKVFNTI